MSTPLNDALVPGQATRSSDRPGSRDTRLRGRRLILARVGWGAAVTLIAVAFLAKLLASYTFLQTICAATCGLGQPSPDSAQAMQKLGLSLAPLPVHSSASRASGSSTAEVWPFSSSSG